MTGRQAWLDGLAAIVGDTQLLTEAGDLAAYRADGRGGGGCGPLAVVRPADAEEVSAIVRLAVAEGARIVVQGGRTGLVGSGLAESERDLVVNLDRLSRRIEIDPINRTATVDAGVRLSALNAAAAEHGLFLPIDLGADPSIGGMIAANTGGARLLRYGDMRANLLAMEVVRSDRQGARIDLGAALWKNNAGLDLKQMLVGSSGSLGIVTRATVVLQPLPGARVTALVALHRAEDALQLLLAAEAGFGTWLTAFEGMSRAAMAAALAHVPGLRAPFVEVPVYSVLIELSAGNAFDDDILEDRLAAVLGPFMEGERAPVVGVAIDRRDGLWAIRHAVPEGLRARGGVVACDIAMPRGDVMRFREAMATRIVGEAPGFEPHDFGHIGDGGVHFNLVWPQANGPLDPVLAERARSMIFEAAVVDFGGSFSAEHGVGPRNGAYYSRFVPSTVRQLAGQVQRIFAPHPIGLVDFQNLGDA